MRDAGRNHDADIVAAAIIVAVDKKMHAPRRQAGPDVTQKNFRTTLEEKHDVPLFAIVRSQRIVLRLIDEQTPQPFLCRSIRRNVRWMNMKTFRSVREHSRSRPLPWPKPYPAENPPRLAAQFAKTTTMTLQTNFSGKNFNAGNPNLLQP